MAGVFIGLRKAGVKDRKEVSRQNALFFNHAEEYEWFPEKEEEQNKNTYMVELDETVIGKISVSYSDRSAFISGFGILPDFRGKGYGKAALIEVIRVIRESNIDEIELDVECKNSTALNLYKACGFEELSVMNYYTYVTGTTQTFLFHRNDVRKSRMANVRYSLLESGNRRKGDGRMSQLELTGNNSLYSITLSF